MVLYEQRISVYFPPQFRAIPWLKKKWSSPYIVQLWPHCLRVIHITTTKLGVDIVVNKETCWNELVDTCSSNKAKSIHVQVANSPVFLPSHLPPHPMKTCLEKQAVTSSFSSSSPPPPLPPPSPLPLSRLLFCSHLAFAWVVRPARPSDPH